MFSFSGQEALQGHVVLHCDVSVTSLLSLLLYWLCMTSNEFSVFSEGFQGVSFSVQEA